MVLFYFLFSWCVIPVFSEEADNIYQKNIERQKLIGELDSFYDANTDYSRFTGRTTDRDKSGHILKITSDNGNIKFLQTGDVVKFSLSKSKDKQCKGYVRGTEKKYFILYVRDLNPCWEKEDYFRRGTILLFSSAILASRIRDASTHRTLLIKKRRDYLRQLNETNNFLWSYDQKRVAAAVEYDKKILELRHFKQKEIGKVLTRKKDSIKLRGELVKQLDKIDKDIDFYRIEVYETEFDRWNMDIDLGLPVSRRPPKLKRL